MNNTNSPHTAQLIHAAVELVVGAGITFWLNRKISSVSQKVRGLEDKLKFYENMLGQHHELIKKLFSIIENRSLETVKPVQPKPEPALPTFTAPADSMHTLLDSPPRDDAMGDFPEFEKQEKTAADPADTTAALDAILTNEIKDLKTDQIPLA